MAEHDGGGERAEMAPGGSGPVTRLSLPETSGTVPEIAAATGQSSAQAMAAGDASSNPGDSRPQGQAELTRRQVAGAIGLGLAIALVGTGGFMLGLTHVFEQGEGVHLEIDPAALDLGEVWAQTGLEVRLPVRNIGMRPVTVFDVRTTGCLCTSATPRQFILGPGQEAELTLMLDLTSRDTRQPMQAREEFTIGVSLLTGRAGVASREWRLSGAFHRPFLPRPARLCFEGAAAVVRGAAGPRQAFRLDPVQPIGHFSVDAPPELSVRAVPGDGAWQLEVEPGPDVPPGPFSYEVLVQAHLPWGHKLPPYALRVEGSCVEEIALIPAVLDMPMVVLGATDSRVVLVRSLRGRPLSIESLSADAEELAVRVESCGDGQAELEVRFTPVRAGLFKGSVRLMARCESDPARELTLPVYAQGLAPSHVPPAEAIP